MASAPSTLELDYSSLNKSLHVKRPIDWIRTDTAKAIWDVFLATSPETKRLKKDSKGSISKKNEKLNEVGNSLRWWSEEIKTKFIMTINHLSENGLLNPASIKLLKIEWKDASEKLENIIKSLKASLSEQDKSQLDKAVSDWIEKHYLELANKDDLSEELKVKNEELEEELNASEAVNAVVESAVLTRRSLNNSIRVWKAIEKINENKKWLDAATKARKVLWQANSFAIFGSWKRFDWINKLPRRFDIKTEYNNVVENLNNKMDGATKAKEKVAIRYIMRQVNKAYTDYIDAISIDEETRRWNMKTINMKMAS